MALERTAPSRRPRRPSKPEPLRRRRTREHSAEEILQKIFDHLPVMIILFDRDGRIRLINREWERTLGWTLEEIERDAIDILAECYPDPAERERVLRYITRADRKWGDFKARTRDGRVIDTTWFNVKLSDGTIIGLGADITERKRTEEELRASREELRALAGHLQSVREEERTRIARELHDDLGQALTALRLDLSWLTGRLARSGSSESRALAERARAMIEVVDQTVQAVRRTATELRPGILDDCGLGAAIEWQASDFQKRMGIRCEVMVTLSSVPAREVATAVFRIVQEALTNAARHAGARRVRIELRESNGDLVVQIADDGRGITHAERSNGGSLGLLGMRERARLLGGDVIIAGTPGRGTTVTAWVQLPPPGDG